MLGRLTFTLLTWLVLFHQLVHSSSNPDTNTQEEIEFPDPIPGADFSKEISKGLHVVDFFSPYCPHCKHLEPVWQKTWKKFDTEYGNLNLTFSRVDCIASGDLCNAESIEYYPTIRLYGPEGAIKNYPETGKRTVESFIEFARKEALNPDNFAEANLRSTSVRLSDNEIIKLLAGTGDAPYLVSFWPTKAMDNTDDYGEFVDCAHCTPFQRVWRLLSTQLMEGNIKSGHVNCVDSPVLCNELGFEKLVPIDNDSREREPRVALILPNKQSNNLFVFPDDDFEIYTKVYEDFALRLTHNNNAPDISKADILKIMQQDIDFGDSNKENINDQKIHLVFSYDSRTVVPEDLDVLEHLIEPLQALPNVYLYKINESIVDVTRTGYNNMYSIIKNNDKDAEPLTLNENSLVLNSITQMPTFFIFRDGDTTSQVFPGYSTTETRNPELIMSWVKLFAKPLFSEMTPSNFRNFMELDRDVFSTIILLIANTSDPNFIKSSSGYLRNINVAGYEYEHERLEEMYENVIAERREKKEYIQHLRNKSAKPDKIVDATLLDVDHVNNLRLSLAYYDIDKYDETMSWIRTPILKGPLKAGEILIIDRTDGRVFQFDSSGNVINSDSPSSLRDIFLSVSLPGRTSVITPEFMSMIVTIKRTTKMTSLSPTRMLYLIVVVLCFLIVTRSKKLYRKYRTRKLYRNKRDTIGLLGKEVLQD
ncbi:similar to Saccharomyces cerevisiae YIL005W EPS1 ER protein with chaperone and co-chaperone activity, involved in retention of resident ER proteins [Maudiozyma barnettii]|uniref:Similar to Saccharomyces cerevisiae YIL005W EPS1 ER protein with chaperone and co-chaperone activity, involved in retention of resident ER proteins n=1 Tax=Maudiozyma barnettii TaxID=61262 RepID=A0A8H2VIW5_9SACH|nr:protein disulfide isomerase EPS1 [Kazachstania barnettii]CAB4256385.1 similar to Saccharomyces cerevisiae YIL005W EPS1 ER protein with chaperone and co-chaperone activity, involved in retention of resident ER proteins [Kazachstania barnettii]CAD1784994.1 similar to Saccharomyces cerevisiae YIL005W EPS1 ER protein with chaperone and co-chaperone activity, involved in retention of resident ER proteins [Kazachstania barnettii]